MTLFLGVIAALLVIAIVAAAVASSRNDEVVGFTRPGDLAAATHAARVGASSGPLIDESPGRRGGSVNIAPAPVAASTLEDLLAPPVGAQPSTLSTFYPGNLGVGTTLSYRGVDSVIFGVLSFDFEDILWQDYLAEHAAGQWWRFGVEPDRGMKLAAFEPRALGVEPGPPSVEYEGDIYHVTESGQANYRSAGITHQPERGRYQYFDYENGARVILSFERFDDGPWMTSIGHHVDPESVRVCNALPEL